MPSKLANLLVFLIVAALSLGMHYYVYRSFCNYLRAIYPQKGEVLCRLAGGFFLLMETPFVYLFLLHRIKDDVSALSRAILIPFTIWQFVLFVWGVVLVAQYFLSRTYQIAKRRNRRES